MRPPEFTGGNLPGGAAQCAASTNRFNEAAGIHRRKHRPPVQTVTHDRAASMRPPEFTGGNV